MTKISINDAQIEAAREAGKVSLEKEPHAEKAWYEAGFIWIVTTTGIYHGVPCERLQGLQGASLFELENVEVDSIGVGLHWPQLDVDLTVKGIMSGVYGSKSWMKEVAKQENVRRSQSELKTAIAPASTSLPTAASPPLMQSAEMSSLGG